jgi:hypothetical protein
VLNGANRQRDTKIFPDGSGRAAIAASNCAGVNRPSSSPARGSGAEFLKRLPESAAAVNANTDTTRTVRNSIFMDRPFQDSLMDLRDESSWYHARREFVKDAVGPVAGQFEFP